MKTVIIASAIILLIFTKAKLIMSSSQNIESYPYKVIKKYEEIEIREYEASLFTSVKLDTDRYEEGSSRGFSILAGYIFGGNEGQQKIAMTSPVSMSLEDSMEVMFMVPSNYAKEDLPKPKQSNIEFKQEPAKTMAAITFGGWASDTRIESYKQLLKGHLDRLEIDYTDRFYFHGFNPPYEVTNRRNEVIVELDNSKT